MSAATDERVLVIGTGQMGPGIALSFALAGYRVTLSGRRPAGVDAGLRSMAASAQIMIESGLLTPADWDEARDRVTGTVGYADAARTSTYLVEAVLENLPLKQQLFAELGRLAPVDALLASTTSTLSPTEMQRDLARPERLVVTHYIQPAQLVPLAEVVPGEQTARATVERACAALQRCGVRPVLCRDVPGFIFSRVVLAVFREMSALVRDGIATPDDIDLIIKAAYAPRLAVMGPFEHADLGSLDQIARVANVVYPHLDCSKDASSGPLADRIAQGHLGMKTQRGFYNWTEAGAAEFRRRRDLEIIRRLKSHRAERRQHGE